MCGHCSLNSPYRDEIEEKIEGEWREKAELQFKIKRNGSVSYSISYLGFIFKGGVFLPV